MAAVGVLGGTFDPIHWGHLILAEQARERFCLDKVLLIPAADPPHKSGQRVTDAGHRYSMTCLGISGNAHFECSRLELDRPGKSYTIDTVRQLREHIGDGELFVLVGADEARDLMAWREPYGIQEMATIAVANRPGLTLEGVLESLPGDFRERLLTLDMPGVGIASTDLRERVRHCMSIRYLAPDAVVDYIRDNNLYRGKE